MSDPTPESARPARASSGLSRREWLVAGAALGGAIATRRLIGQSAAPATTAPPGSLVMRNARPLDAEAPLAALADDMTGEEQFFVRSHFGPPAQLPLAWTLAIDGQVARPASLSLDEIRKLGAESRVVTLECAGNGRGVFQLPKTSGVQWGRGAVSTSTWTGVPLGTVLARAGLQSTARHVWSEALDRAPLSTVPKFMRSIPLDVARGDAFVAYEMNGRPIPLLHGGPLRLIVPGWFGMASTKWLTHLHAMPTESDNYFMARGYRYADGTGVTTMRVKSVIAAPLDGQHVRAGSLTLRGQAWTGAGAGGIRGVDISSDGGRTWRPASLTSGERSGAWRGWKIDLSLQPGPAVLMARATDGAGNVQPMNATPNPGGYGNNSIHQVAIDVA